MEFITNYYTPQHVTNLYIYDPHPPLRVPESLKHPPATPRWLIVIYDSSTLWYVPIYAGSTYSTPLNSQISFAPTIIIVRVLKACPHYCPSLDEISYNKCWDFRGSLGIFEDFTGSLGILRDFWGFYGNYLVRDFVEGKPTNGPLYLVPRPLI